MVETWEIEWNNSMLKHGRDLGTMDFIFAKGGSVADMNYVMFDIQDNTWEPLIKAVAERDNSHPDIIRKQAEQQQPFFMQQGQSPAQQFMGTGARSPREMTRIYNTAQRGQNLMEYHDNPTAMNALRAGKYGTAAGKGLAATGRGIMQGVRGARDYMRDKAGPAMASAGRKMGEMGGRALQAVKESGIGGRMKNFMSNVKHTPGALMDTAKQGIANRGEEARRSLLEGAQGKYQNELQRLQGRYGGKDPLSASQLNSAIEDLNQRYQDQLDIRPQKIKGKDETLQEAMSREVGDIGDRLTQPRGFRAALEARKNPQQPAAEEPAAEEVAQIPLPDAPSDEVAEQANTDAPIEFGYEEEEKPITEEPPMTATQPTKEAPVKPGQTATATVMGDDARGQFADRMLDEAGYNPGDSRKKARDIALGLYEKPESYEAITSATGSRGYRGKLAEAIAAHHGLTPTQAQQVVQEADNGNPQAKKIVEDAIEFGEESVSGNPTLTFSQDKHTAAWDSLLKGLNIR